MNKIFTDTASKGQMGTVLSLIEKTSYYAVLLLTFVFCIQQTALAQSTPPAIPNTSYLGAYNNCHYYKVTTSDVTNEAAASTCYTYGGRLPKVTSSAHNTWLKGKVGGKCWLGLDNAHVTNTWCHHDLSTPTYTNWGTGVFSWITSWFGLSTVNYGCLDLDGYWKNFDKYAKAWCVIEVPYTPTTTTTNTCVCTPPTVPNCTFLGTYDNAHYYKSNKGDLDSYQANALCKEYGGRLPRIKSSGHNTWLKGVCGEGYWLGHHKLTGTWKYQDGLTALGYANWNLSAGYDTYAKCELDGSWKSCNIFAKTKCVIEIPCVATPQPAIAQYISVDNGTYNPISTVSVCSGQTVKLDFAATYPTTWKFVYTRPDGTTFPGGTNGVESDQIQFQVATSGVNLINKGTWKVTYTNPNGCSNTASFIVNVTPTVVTINNCPQNINLTASGTCAAATWTAPTATSTCGTPAITSNFASGYCFPVGTTAVNYIATLNGVTANCSFNVIVAAPAPLPIAKDDNATVPPNTPITITPLSNDVINGTFQSIAIKSQPANGSVVLSGNDFVFTPAAGFFGTTTFTYCFTTSNGTSNTATVTVVVPAPAPLPVANDDNATTPQNTAVTITPLSNDVVNGTFQTIAIKSQPANGSVVLNGNTFVFTPTTGFFGTTTFTYCFTTSNGTSNTATVTVVVPAPAPLPVANNDNATTPQNTAVTITPLSNDVVNGTFQTIAIKSQPANGSVVLSGNTFVFTPATGFFGTTTFTYCFTTTNGTSNTATVTVVVPAPAPLPVANDDNATTPQNTAVTITPLSNDVVNGTFQSIAIKSQPANGSVVLNGNDFVFTPTNGFSGTTTFTYCFTTTNGTSNTATVTVVVPQVTSGNVCTSPVSNIIGGSSIVTITGITTSAAIIQVFNETFTANVSTTQVSTAIGTVVLPAGNYNVKVTVLGQGGTYPAVCEVVKLVTVTGGTQNAPVAVDDNATTPQNTAVTISPLSNDVTTGTFQSITIKSQPVNGNVVVNGTDFVFTPTTGFSGTTTFTYCFTTSNGTSNTATVTVVVPAPAVNCNEVRNNSISTTCVSGAPVLKGTVLAGYEYQWLSSTSVCPNGPSQAIAGATNADLVLPSVVAQTTYFMRCARPIGCTLWDAITESNCLTVTPTDCAGVVLVGCDAVNAIGNSNGTIGVAGMGNFTSQILVFNSQWQPVSNQQYNVPATTISVKNGSYIVKVQLYNTVGGWNFVCEKQFNVTVSGGIALLGNTPILELSAKAEMRHVQLGWANNTGDKVDYFEVEKLNNATGSFEPLTWVNSKHTDKLEYYTTKDEQPTEGDNTYRVNVTTYDGTKKISNTSTIKYSNVYDFRAFPNPANSMVSVDLTNYKNQATEVYLYNYLGQVSQVIKSENVTSTIVEFDVTNEPVGQYSIRVKSKGKRDVIKPLVITH